MVYEKQVLQPSHQLVQPFLSQHGISVQSEAQSNPSGPSSVQKPHAISSTHGRATPHAPTNVIPLCCTQMLSFEANA